MRNEGLRGVWGAILVSLAGGVLYGLTSRVIEGGGFLEWLSLIMIFGGLGTFVLATAALLTAWQREIVRLKDKVEQLESSRQS